MTQNGKHPAGNRKNISPVAFLLAFLRLGLTSFGGPTMVAYIRELAVNKKRWLSDESFADGVALCQGIPGATAMQTAAYAGFRAGGPLGALAAFAGFGFPAFALMVILSALYQKTRDLGPVISAFHGRKLLIEVDKKAPLKSEQLEIGHDLRRVNVVEIAYRLDFNQ